MPLKSTTTDKQKAIIVWFREDFRLQDNPALAYAVKESQYIIPIYILDTNTSKKWQLGGAQRWWLHHSLLALQQQFLKQNCPLILRRGDPSKILKEIIANTNATGIYWNRCYEPFALIRDNQIKEHFEKNAIAIKTFNGSLLFEPWEIKNNAGKYFKVFTPFWKNCFNKGEPPLPLTAVKIKGLPIKLKSEKLTDWKLLPTHPNWAKNFDRIWQPGEKGAQQKLKLFIKEKVNNYDKGRDQPELNFTSMLSPHLHFGEISPKQIWHSIIYKQQLFSTSQRQPVIPAKAGIHPPTEAMDSRFRGNDGKDIKVKEKAHSFSPNANNIKRFLTELGWREFSYHLLYHFPELPEKSFRSDFEKFPWQKNSHQLKAWQQGKTGYPIVDAGMRQLWQIGWMHNRVRMIVASFLTKDLLLPWQIGAAWFWDTLVDADLANNSASWQWVAGSGADASPYFRIFNPVLQGEKFDPDGNYVKSWIPELKNLPKKYLHQPWLAPKEILAKANVRLGIDYPLPIINHDQARKKAIALYKILKPSRVKDK